MSGGAAGSRVAEGLRDRLRTGALPPGTLLSQSEIAAEYGVSRIPVRDALYLLSAEGLVELGPAGAVVAGLSIRELQELYEMREAIEPVVTGIAVPNVGRAETTQMAALLDRMESADISPAEWLEANAQFHALVYTRADRPRMVALTEQLRRQTDRYVYLHLEVIGDVEHLHEEHRRILAAVRRGDPREVADLTRLHLETSHDFILRYLLRTAPADDGEAESAAG
ncbi:GntR family transcriptional regulator [Geodermatophilus sp. YIM 151500]|uniref:GntR family transcriptional regulator n=1 Tax=Geodermatophilus sp. YIM 151500 TaxID=2984531 RepID=UPI0021E494CA|nr:GntR family transcriptional regulator [Geodermatophilus sp. YIM 151500]MCV2488836.1 GntR family transcriptional regulator [Geodermatophilus sp. YIM 151500]